MTAHRLLWAILVLALVVAIFVWTPMTLAPAALFFGVLLFPLVLLAGFGVYHVVRGARRPQEA